MPLRPPAPAPYVAPWWLPGGHLQTIYAALARPERPPPYRRESWSTPDGDFIEVDWTGDPGPGPVVVLFHGLEGSSRSPYAAAVMRAALTRGWCGVVPHFRGCGGRPNRLSRAYHSGDADEIDWILRRIAFLAGRPVCAVGVSLGGNALLKWLGRESGRAADVVRSVAAVCPPLDLSRSGPALGTGFNRIYSRHFLRTLKPKTLAKLRTFPGMFDARRVARASDFETFDDAYTAPAHGFADVHDYWRRASSKPDLPRIEVPTLILSARNDPFVPADCLPVPAEVSRHVTLEQPATGGHVGFVSGTFPGTLDWLTDRLFGFFDDGSPGEGGTATRWSRAR